jgi:hypothetical protein
MNNSNSSIIDKILYDAGDFEEIQVTLRLKKNIAFVGRLISYQYNKSFDEFVSEEIIQAILSIGPDYLNSNQSLKEYSKQLLDEDDV